MVHLDEAPAAAARQYSNAEGAAQQPGEPPGALQPPWEQPFGWLGGLLFGRWRGDPGGSGGARRRVDASTWREFEKDFTEV